MNYMDESWLEKSFEHSLSLWDFSLNSPLSQGLEPYIPIDLFTASSIGDLGTVKYIISRQNSCVNALNGRQWNALMYATFYGYEEVACFLLDKGADIQKRNLNGENVLMIAAKNGFETLVEYYIKREGIIETRDIKDWTALMYAVSCDHLDAVGVLLNYRANVNACIRSTGKTPLLLAAENGNLAMVELLLQAGANYNFKSVDGKDAYAYAVKGRHERVADFLNQWRINDSRRILTPSIVGKYSLFDRNVHQDPTMPFPYQKLVKNNEESELTGPSVAHDLDSLLTHSGLSAYIPLFREQEVDLFVFLTLTDADLEECGVTKLGPRRKMMTTISRWFNNAPIRRGLEASYASKLEAEKRELEEELEVIKNSNLDLKTRLQECQKRYLVIREQLSAVIHYGTLSSYQKASEIIEMILAYMEEIFKITTVAPIKGRRAT